MESNSIIHTSEADLVDKESYCTAPAAFTGKFTKLGLFEMGANGTCIRPLATFDL